MHLDVADVVHLELALEDRGVRGVADRDEERPACRSAECSPVFVSSRVTPWIPLPGSPWISRRPCSVSRRSSGFMRARSSMILEARNSSRRWTIVTLRARTSSGTSPLPSPCRRRPRRATSFPLKKKPSQVAQADTPVPHQARLRLEPEELGGGARARPRPRRPSAGRPRRASDGTGRAEKSTSTTVSRTTSVPNRMACSRKISMSSGPWIPLGSRGSSRLPS